MRRFVIASSLLAFCLSGCAASNNKDFEKEILGQPAPEMPPDTGWSRASSPPPPPPPAAYRPAPYAGAPAPSQPAAPKSVAEAGQPASMPQGASAKGATLPPPVISPPPALSPEDAERFKPKPFKPGQESDGPAVAVAAGQPAAPVSPASPEATPASAPYSAPTPAAPPAPAVSAAAATPSAPGDRAVFTFQVGDFAHADKAQELVKGLEGRGFSARMDQGKRNNKTFYRVFATKEGNRAELEGELLAGGVTEPRLTEERPLDAAPAAKKAAAPKEAAAKVSPANPRTNPPVGEVPKASAKATAPRQSGNIPPPMVEPAPPLPDGYVPPPPKKSGS